LKPDASVRNASRNESPWRGSRVKARRKELHITQEDLAERTGISVNLLSAYENDRILPRKENRQRILDALDGTGPATAGDAPASIVNLAGSPERPARGEVLADTNGRCLLCGEVERVADSCGATVLASWVVERGAHAAIASGRDHRLLFIQANVTQATLGDMVHLRALVDRLEEQLHAHAP
jgi:DNA-binding XRE family transcriptional regulator